MYRILATSWILLFWGVTSYGQYTPDKYWEMEDVTKVKQILRSPSMTPELQTGFLGNAIFLDGKSTELNLGALLKMDEAITVSFWFKPQQFFGEQSLLRQSRVASNAKGEAGRFIEVFLNDNWVRTRNEKRTLSGDLSNLNILAQGDQDWLFFTYTGDEYGYQIYIQGQEVTQSTDGTMFRDLGNFTNDLVIGKGKGNFIGWIDEVKIFYENMDAYMVKSLLKTDRKRRQTTPVLITETSSTSEVPDGVKQQKEKKSQPIKPTETVTSSNRILPEKKETEKKRFLKDREIVIYNKNRPIVVEAPTIRIKIWDSYRRIDNDQVSIFLNEETKVIQNRMTLTKKRRYQEVVVKLADQEENLLIFYADNTGNYESSASIALEVEGYDQVFEMTANNKSNPALKFIQKEIKKPKLETIASVVTNEETIHLEFLKGRNSDPNSKSSIRVKTDGSGSFYPVFLKDEPQIIEIDLQPNESKKILIQRNQDWGNAQNTDIVKLVVKDKSGILKRHPLFLHKKYYEIAVKRNQKLEVIDDGQRKIKIPKTIKEITLELSDHDKPDQDTISIEYDNKMVVSKQELLTKSISKKVQLNPGLLKHQLFISTDSYGKSPEPISTPLIRVMANGKKVDEFVFRLRKGSNNGSALIELFVEE